MNSSPSTDLTGSVFWDKPYEEENGYFQTSEFILELQIYFLLKYCRLTCPLESNQLAAFESPPCLRVAPGQAAAQSTGCARVGLSA